MKRLIEKLLYPSTTVKFDRLFREIKGKTILITGASSGIGEAIAFALAPFDVHLILLARREKRLIAIKNTIEKERAAVTVFKADLRCTDERQKLIDFIQHLPSGVDILVNNAGKSIRRSIFQSLDRYHDFTRTIELNYLAPVQILLQLIPLLEKNQGQIINISTINTKLIPFPFWAAYQASKTAFDTWLLSVAPELNAKGIATSSIYLPLVKTPMIEPTVQYRNTPTMSVEQAAKIVIKTMYTKKKVYKPWWLIGGQWASVLFRGIWEKYSPNLYRKRSGE